MKFRNRIGFGAVAMTALLVSSCGDDKNPLGAEPLGSGLPNVPDVVGGLAEQCGLTCDAKGIVEGNASISGTPSIDAFFGSVVNFKAKASLISEGINIELARIAIAAGARGKVGAELKAAIDAKIAANVEGSLKINAQPAKCQASVKATLEAQAKCEGSVTPPTASVACSGSCEVDASADVSCDASAMVVCKGQAPELKCSGTCSGKCEVELNAAAACDGTCKGSTDAGGMCMGSCETDMSGGGTCMGKCKGECEYTPPDAKCDANAKVECKAMAGGSVMCNGRCEGEVTPGSAKAECNASAKADASVNVECTPPKLNVEYSLNATAEADANARAEFEAFLEIFVDSYAKILAHVKNVEVLVAAGAELGGAAEGAVKGAVDGLKGEANLKVAVGAACALTELPKVVTVLNTAKTELEASASSAAMLTAGFAG